MSSARKYFGWILLSYFSMHLSMAAEHVDIEQGLNTNEIKKWVLWNSQALTSAYGQLPQKELRVSVVSNKNVPRASASNEAIPWGQVQRRTTHNQIHFVVNQNASYQDLTADWTGYHEYSHLLIPYRGWGELWFSEGLASYYQNILQFRIGILSAAQAKQKLLAGFKRGMANNQAAEHTLSSVSDEMRRHRAFMRVYWSGAWYFWQADQKLREQGQTLDLALLYLDECCSHRQLSAKQIVERLDEYSLTPVFAPLFKQVSNSHSLTIDDKLWQQLEAMEWPKSLTDHSNYLPSPLIPPK